MRRSAWSCLLCAPLLAQIDKKPEFDQRDRFRSSQVEMAIDSDSHTSGMRGATLNGMVNRYLRTEFANLPPAQAAKLAEVRSLLRTQDFRGAADSLASADAAPVFHLGRAVTAVGLGNASEAASILCAAANSDADVRTALPFIGDLLELNPGPATCLRERLSRFHRQNPKDAQGAYVYALALLHTDPPDAQAAEALLQQAAQLKPSAAVQLELGKLYASSGRNEEAIRSLEKAVAIQPEMATAHYRLSQLYRLAGKPDLAREHLDAWRRYKDLQ